MNPHDTPMHLRLISEMECTELVEHVTDLRETRFRALNALKEVRRQHDEALARDLEGKLQRLCARFESKCEKIDKDIDMLDDILNKIRVRILELGEVPDEVLRSIVLKQEEQTNDIRDDTEPVPDTV